MGKNTISKAIGKYSNLYKIKELTRTTPFTRWAGTWRLELLSYFVLVAIYKGSFTLRTGYTG
jgi:hypothetical protein